MELKRSFVVIFLAAVTFYGCSLFPGGKSVDKNAKEAAKQEKKLETVNKGLISNSEVATKQASALVTGIEISLNQVTNKTLEIETAQNLAQRVITIVGSPTLAEHEKIKSTVLLLNSSVQLERERGAKLLAERDSVIIALQKQREELEKKYDAQVEKISENARNTAKNADQNQSKIDQIDGFWGLSAVWYGTKRFVITSLWVIIGGLVIFIVLRLLAASHPAISALFGIFEFIGSLVINAVKVLAPKAAQLASLMPKSDYAKYKNLCLKIVDNIAELKYNTKVADKTYSLQEVLAKFSEDFDQSDKDLVEELTIETKWKK
jgi:Ca2+/Na+ antiporter